MSAPFPSDPTFSPAVFYRDPRTAVAWLERAFGFEIVIAIDSGDPATSHYELSFRGGRLMVGGEWKDSVRSPASVEHVNTQHVHVRLEQDLDGHCERARAAGAVIAAEPRDEFYGDRTYRAVDPEGHEWTFFQHVRAVSRAEAEAELGAPIDAPTWA